jgi:hypothetical protein
VSPEDSTEKPNAPLPWESLPDDELLKWKLCDLHVKIAGSEVEPRVQNLYAQLEARGIPVRPRCYLGDEWLSPTDVPAIAIPFYLAHPRLKQLEHKIMLEVEGGTPEWCDKLLFHECGHAIDHAYGFSTRRGWKAVFGDPQVDYHPETYRPRPYSRAFVRHLPNWYAQAHPDEDFAESFAVWLALTPDQWRQRYAGWKALEKLEYIEKIMKLAVKKPPRRTGGRLIADVTKAKKTLSRHYAARRKLWSADYPDFYDADLRKIFGELTPGDESAARFMRRYRRSIVSATVNWTGEPKYTVDGLAKKLITRSAALNLGTPRDEPALLIDIGSYLSALVTNYLHTGKFKRNV